MRNVIYQYKWKGIQTKWDYWIEFIPADTTPLNNPDVFDLPEGTIVSLSYSYRYDKFPLGMPESPSLKIKINIDRIPNDASYVEFKKAILSPAMMTNWIFQALGDSVFFEFPIGTIINLYIKPTGFTYYLRVFQGLAIDIEKVKYETETNRTNVSFEAINILKHVLESFNFSGLKLYSDYQHSRGNIYIEDSGVTEFLTITTNPKQTVEHYNTWHYFRMRQFSFLFEYIQTFANEIMLISSRGTVPSTSFTSNTPMIKMYKQVYDKSGNRGDQVINPYIIFDLVYQDGTDETSVNGIWQMLRDTYQNSVWDFIRELSEWQLSSAFVFNHICMFGYLLGSDDFFLEILPSSIKSIDIELSKNRVKTVTASLYESYNGTKFSDITDYNAVKGGTLNQDGITLPMIFNNTPTCVEYKHFNNPYGEIKQTFFPHIRSLYYYDSEYRFIRIHEYCEYYIKNNLLSSSLPICSFYPFDYNQAPFSHFEYLIADLQVVNCMHQWASRSLLEVFSKIDQSFIKISLPLTDISEWQEGTEWMFISKLPWLIPLCNIKFILRDIDNNLPNIEKWKVVESNVDFLSESVDFKLLSITV